VGDLDSRRVGEYFARPGTVERWWTPDSGPLSFHYDVELDILEDALEVDPDWRVLDVGTGRGRFGLWFAERGCRVVGVDLNPEMLEAARQHARERGLEERIELRQGSADDLALLGDTRFDVVLCMELFDHLPDLERSLAAMRGVLAEDGRFLFTYVPGESLYGGIGNVYRWLRARLSPEETMISRTYALGEVRRRLAASGLELERYWGIGLLCLNAQTRLFTESPFTRMLTGLARAEANRWPYYARPWLARHGAHVVGLARPRTEAREA